MIMEKRRRRRQPGLLEPVYVIHQLILATLKVAEMAYLNLARLRAGEPENESDEHAQACDHGNSPPQARLAGTAMSISFGLGSTSDCMIATYCSSLLLARRGLWRRSSPMLEEVHPL